MPATSAAVDMLAALGRGEISVEPPFIVVLQRRGDTTRIRIRAKAAADEPALTDLLAESVAFPRARIVDPDRARPATDPAWLGSVAGFNLHAGVALSALDREGRERLCKYLLRPPVSDDRLSLREDGRVALQLKTPWRDGTVAKLFTPEQFVARLAAQGGDRAVSPCGRGRRRVTTATGRARATESSNGPVPALA